MVMIFIFKWQGWGDDMMAGRLHNMADAFYSTQWQRF